ncbi:MAG: efflux RND transporter periplasmic adaptor subunit [Sphingobacteriaceae bacterium]
MYIRQTNLWKELIGRQLELDQRRLSFLNSKDNYHAAVNKLHQLKTDLENRQKQADISYHISKNQQNDYIIRSAFKGKVFDVFKEQGELIGTQSPLAIIGEANTFILEMSVDEYDVVKVKPGQAVELTMDSYKGKVFRGVISKIYPIIDERQRTFKVDAHFIDLPETLYPNLTAEANIVINVKNNAVLIPKNTLLKTNLC